MTAQQNFVIRRTFLIPLGILLALSVLLFAVILIKGEPLAKVVILGVIILPVAGFFAESAVRRFRVSAEEVRVDKLFRQKSLPIEQITAVDTVLVKKRAFLTISTEEDFIILSNAYANFPVLVHTLLQRVPPAAISEETRQMAVSPPSKSTDIISCWLAVILLAFILYIQLMAGR